MLIEMVAVTLTVVSGFSSLSEYISPAVTSPVPAQALESSVPEEQLIAMLTEPEEAAVVVLSNEETLMHVPAITATPTPEPTATPTPLPTNTPTPEPTATPTPQAATAAPVDVESLFTRFSGEYSVDKELLKRIAKCESSFNSEAANGDYLGMFQFAASSWGTVRNRMGADPNPDLRKNAEEAIKTAAFHIANGGQNAWPSCQ